MSPQPPTRTSLHLPLSLCTQLGVSVHPDYKVTAFIDHSCMLTVKHEKYGEHSIAWREALAQALALTGWRLAGRLAGWPADWGIGVAVQCKVLPSCAALLQVFHYSGSAHALPSSPKLIL